MGPVHLLEKLEQAGYEAYFVGGCVRDTLLGRSINDWDITTSASPDGIMQVFPRTVPTGLKHGTVTVLDGESGYEVTTFRHDGQYQDGRHPRQVTFVGNLQEDLSRRDFTVNAMAMDKNGNLTDLFGGRNDLENKLIRCVGEPVTRFREDALRMLRALRFSSQLGFSVEERTMSAIRECAALCRVLSVERVRDEVEKTLLSSNPQAVGDMAALGLLQTIGLEEGKDISFLSSLPAEPQVRWAGLFMVYPALTWQSLRLDKKTGQTAMKAARLGGEMRTRQEWKKVICQHSAEVARCASCLAGQSAVVEEILASRECLCLQDLAVSGKDFPELTGKKLGEHLQKLLYHVLEHPGDNDRQTLLDYGK